MSDWLPLPTGLPFGSVTTLAVHAAIRVDDAQDGLPELPVYVPRDLDADLRTAVAAAADHHQPRQMTPRQTGCVSVATATAVQSPPATRSADGATDLLP
jgi:hypothetical protein